MLFLPELPKNFPINLITYSYGPLFFYFSMACTVATIHACGDYYTGQLDIVSLGTKLLLSKN